MLVRKRYDGETGQHDQKPHTHPEQRHSHVAKSESRIGRDHRQNPGCPVSPGKAASRSNTVRQGASSPRRRGSDTQSVYEKVFSLSRRPSRPLWIPDSGFQIPDSGFRIPDCRSGAAETAAATKKGRSVPFSYTLSAAHHRNHPRGRDRSQVLAEEAIDGPDIAGRIACIGPDVVHPRQRHQPALAPRRAGDQAALAHGDDRVRLAMNDQQRPAPPAGAARRGITSSVRTPKTNRAARMMPGLKTRGSPLCCANCSSRSSGKFP